MLARCAVFQVLLTRNGWERKVVWNDLLKLLHLKSHRADRNNKPTGPNIPAGSTDKLPEIPGLPISDE